MLHRPWFPEWDISDEPCHCLFLNFQRRLQNWEEAEHAQSDPVHCQSVPKGQDLAAKDQAQQTAVPDLPGYWWFL